MLPGYYKQLKTGPRLGPQKSAEHPTAHSWAWMREEQLKALELEHTSVVNTIDLGDAKNIHPRDKLPVGQRAALLAVSETLGKDVISHGPMLKTVDAQGDRLIVHFENAEGLKTIDGSAPTGFWVADGSRKWVKADAKIDGQTVVLSVSKLKKAIYVRYAFAGKPSVNLVNGANLPAYPFRTDAFEPARYR